MIDQISQMVKHKSVLEIQGTILQEDGQQAMRQIEADQEQNLMTDRSVQLDRTADQDPDAIQGIPLLGENPSPKRVGEELVIPSSDDR